MTTPTEVHTGEVGSPLLVGRLIAVAAGVVVLLVLGVLGFAMMRNASIDPKAATPAKFTVAPDFTLPTFDGGQLTLSSYDDRPVLLFFWASWCVPCQQEAPYIQRAWPEYERRGFVFMGVNVSDSEADARAFIERNGFTFPVARDQQGRVYLNYGLDLVSESFFLRPGRQVQSRFINGLTEQSLAENLEALAAGSGRRSTNAVTR